MSGTTTLELPRGTASAGIARLIVTAHGAGLPHERLNSANLMVSELVSNAFKYGTGQMTLTVESGSDGVRAEVCDEGRGVTLGPVVKRPARGGWGLYFVERLADAWGSAPGEARVWFSVAAR
jgi:anti-sigma regulatory factor (Ser/Thr protein kinase)